MKTIESRKEIIEQRLNELFDINDKRKFSKEEHEEFVKLTNELHSNYGKTIIDTSISFQLLNHFLNFQNCSLMSKRV